MTFESLVQLTMAETHLKDARDNCMQIRELAKNYIISGKVLSFWMQDFKKCRQIVARPLCFRYCFTIQYSYG